MKMGENQSRFLFLLALDISVVLTSSNTLLGKGDGDDYAEPSSASVSAAMDSVDFGNCIISSDIENNACSTHSSDSDCR